jgi:RNA polymerase sigma-70 factor (ECF subfamily)
MAQDALTTIFEQHRTHLRAVAYRMLGSLAEADEAVQEAWLRASRAGIEGIDNIPGWLTTIVARVCLNALKARKVRRREDAAAVHMPDPIISREGALDPEHEVLLADSVGLALQIVLETLPPAERLAFVLHDMFDISFDEIADMVGRTEAAARQLASRARRRVRGAGVPSPEPDATRQREVVEAFFAAARSGELEALVALLDPDVVLRSDGGRRRTFTFVRRGAEEVARSALAETLPNAVVHAVRINGAAGVIITLKGKPFALMEFAVAHDKIVAIHCMVDPDRLAHIDLQRLD